MLLKNAIKLLRRRLSAYKYGISFVRASKWRLPEKITFHGSQYKITGDDTHGTGTRDAFRDIFIDDEYQVKRILRSMAVKTILDIGGHSGFFSLYCKLLVPEANVHCYEPNPDLAEYINEHLRQVGFTYFPEAVGKESGMVALTFGAQAINTITSLDANGTVRQVAFRDCISKIGGEVDILKMDCEGAEWDILRDIESFQNVKTITMEFHLNEERTVDMLKVMIDSIGFKILTLKFTGPAWGILIAYNKAKAVVIK